MHMIVEPGGGHWGEGPRGTKTLPIVMAFIRTAYHLRVRADADPSKGPPRLIDAAEEKGWLGKNLDGVRVRDDKFQWSWETPVVVGQLLEIAPYCAVCGRQERGVVAADGGVCPEVAGVLPYGDVEEPVSRFGQPSCLEK